MKLFKWIHRGTNMNRFQCRMDRNFQRFNMGWSANSIDAQWKLREMAAKTNQRLEVKHDS